VNSSHPVSRLLSELLGRRVGRHFRSRHLPPIDVPSPPLASQRDGTLVLLWSAGCSKSAPTLCWDLNSVQRFTCKLAQKESRRADVKSAWITPRRFLCKPVVASSRGSAQSRRWKSPHKREFHLPVCRAPPPIHHSGYPCRANTHVALASMHRSGAKGSTVDPTRRSLQTAGYRLPRIPLPRTPVKRRKNKGQGARPRPLQRYS
jgi:hypothetical protein